jgi:hypothetical protein
MLDHPHPGSAGAVKQDEQGRARTCAGGHVGDGLVRKGEKASVRRDGGGFDGQRRLSCWRRRGLGEGEKRRHHDQVHDSRLPINVHARSGVILDCPQGKFKPYSATRNPSERAEAASLVDAGDIDGSDGVGNGVFADTLAEHFARLLRQKLGIAQAANAIFGVEDHGAGNDRSEERSTTDFIDAGDKLRA